jgi:hypothetical protein
MGLSDDFMPQLCEDKCDGNALGGELLCELHHGIDVALAQAWDDYGMNTPCTPTFGRNLSTYRRTFVWPKQ